MSCEYGLQGCWISSTHEKAPDSPLWMQARPCLAVELGYGASSSQEICRVSTVSWLSGSCALGAQEGPGTAESRSGPGVALGNLYPMGITCCDDGEVAMAPGVVGIRSYDRGNRHSNLSKYSQLSMCRLSPTMDNIV